MKTRILLTLLFTGLAHFNLAQAGFVHYNVTLNFPDLTTFSGTFDYDSVSQQVAHLQGTLDDYQMGNLESLDYQLITQNDGKGGITAYVFELNTTAIRTNPPINNNAGVAINFNAKNPTLGVTNSAQLAYMDCSPLALMGQTCMYHLPWNNPVESMPYSPPRQLSQTISYSDPASRRDCLFNWAEINYPTLFSPAGASLQTLQPYYYRYYHNTNSYLGVSSADSNVWYLGPDGNMQNVGTLSFWLTTSGC